MKYQVNIRLGNYDSEEEAKADLCAALIGIEGDRVISAFVVDSNVKGKP